MAPGRSDEIYGSCPAATTAATGNCDYFQTIFDSVEIHLIAYATVICITSIKQKTYCGLDFMEG